MTPPHAPDRPAWIGEVKSDDGVYLYRDGRAEGCPTPEAARDAAFQNAVRGIERDILRSAAGARVREGAGIVPARDVVSLTEGLYEETSRHGCSAWIRVSFPQSLRDRLVAQLLEGVRLNDLWSQALRLQTQGDYAQAIGIVEQAVESYGNPLLAEFSKPEAVSRINELARLRHGQELNDLWRRAVELGDRGQFEEARALLRQAIAGYGEPLGAKFTVMEAQDLIAALNRRERAGNLDGLWNETLKLEQQGAYQAATVKLRTVLEQYQPGLSVSFDIPTAKLKLAELYGEQKDFLEARRWCEDVAKNTQGAPALEAQRRLTSLPPPPRMWPLVDRWGRPDKVVILCAIRDEKGARSFGELATVLENDFRAVRMACANIGPKINTSALSGAFDTQDMSALIQTAADGGASLLLTVLVDIDSARREKTENILGVRAAVPNTVVRFSVLRLRDGAPVYAGQFRETAGGQSHAHLAERAAAILITKYLVPNCPAVAGK